MVDEYLAEDAGSKAAFLERVIGGARIYAYVGATLLSMLHIPVISNAAALGAAALEGDVPPELALAGKFLGYASLGGISLAISKVAFSASRTALRLYQQHGFRGAVGQVYQNGIGLAKRAHAWVQAKIATLRGRACGCFTAATLVWTATGPVPISEIEIGDKVIAQNEVTGEYSVREVLDTTTAYANLLVVVTVEHGDGRQEAIETTEEHPFYVPGRGWVRADVLYPGDRLNVVGRTARRLDEADVGGAGAAPSDVAASSVLSAAFVQHTTTVYNLSVAGINTYLVGPDGVLVHNCPTIRNKHLAGKQHPRTGVPFDADGYPDFAAWTKMEVTIPGGHMGRAADFRHADKVYAAGHGRARPTDMTWHHHQDGMRLQLVDRKVHWMTGHTGSMPGP